jgi:hypothetical protein
MKIRKRNKTTRKLGRKEMGKARKVSQNEKWAGGGEKEF